MARVASNQSLGVLVIDEIQNLSEAKSGGHRKMLNFFVQLINTIGLPVVLVGTYKAMSVLGSEFRQMRRGTGQGDLVWDPMAEDEVWQFASGVIVAISICAPTLPSDFRAEPRPLLRNSRDY